MKHGLIICMTALCGIQLAQAQTDTSGIKTFSLSEVSVEHTRAQAGSGVAYTNLNQKQIRERNLGQDMPFLLQNTPSAVVTSDAGTGIGYTYLRIRGTDATRTSIMLNGVPVNDAESQGTWFVNTPDLASAVQDIQIQRGIGTSTYGPGGFGASINLRTATSGIEPGVYLANSAGSWGTRKHTLMASTGKLYERFSAQIRVSELASDGWVERASARLNSMQADLAYYGKGFKLNLLYLKGQERTYQAWYGVPEELLTGNRRFNIAGTDFFQKADPYKNETDNYGQTHYQLHLDAGISERWSLQSTVFYTLGEGYYEQYKVQAPVENYKLMSLFLASGSTLPNGSLLLKDTTISKSDIIRERWLRNHFFGANSSLRFEDDRQGLTIGAFASRYQGRSFGRVTWASLAQLPGNEHEYYSSPSVKEETSLFVRYSRKLNNYLTATADVQGRGLGYRFSGNDNDLKNLDFSKTWFFFNPKLGLERVQGRFKTSLFAGITHREPTRSSITDVPGPPPTTERLYNVEAGQQITGKGYRIGANLFYMHYQNQLVLTGELNDVGNPIMRNVAASFRRGLEVEGQWQVHPKVSLSGTFTLMQTGIERFTVSTAILGDGGEYVGDTTLSFQNKSIAFSPGQLASGIVQVQVVKGVTAEVIGRFVGRQYLDNTETQSRSLKPYTTVDARIAWQPEVKGIKMLRLTLQALNLFSAQYESNGYTGFTSTPGGQEVNYNYYFPQAPVTLLAGIELGF